MQPLERAPGALWARRLTWNTMHLALGAWFACVRMGHAAGDQLQLAEPLQRFLTWVAERSVDALTELHVAQLDAVEAGGCKLNGACNQEPRRSRALHPWRTEAWLTAVRDQ